jgi:ubiquinone/menaquinone biosynthesis C-methylase UbiE
MINRYRDVPAGQYADSKNLSARADLHTRFSTNPKGWQNWLFQQLDLLEGCRVLEVGCGPGKLWHGRRQSLPRRCRIVLTDSSPGMITEAQQALGGEPFAFAVMDAQAIAHPDDSFDRAVANHMLYHVPDLPRALGELARVLKPGGALLAATNGDAHMRELFEIIRRSVGDFETLVSSFTLENGAAPLRRHFREVTLRRYDDGLVVTDAAALSAYVRSMGSLAGAREEQFLAIENAITDEIRRRGAMAITKDTGVFIARGKGGE